MAEYDNGSLHIVSTKLLNLLNQVHSASSDDLSNGDVRAALGIMKSNLNELLGYVRDAADYSDQMREQIILAATEHIKLHSKVLGFVIRSNTTRNPFELYYPFKSIARQFFPGESVYLILSSEWDYVPFTYPMTLDDLPNFILIGMPAPEADNVLAFPLAGHELGHSIWKRRDLSAHFSPAAFELTKQRFDSSPELLRTLFPGVPEAQFENDLFSSRLKDSAISQIIAYCLRQMEEVFCDLIGISIFGTAYLHAFRYLLAPSFSGERAYSYPELSERAGLLDLFAKHIGLPDSDIARWFSRQEDINHPFYAALVRVSDGVRRELWDDLTKIVSETIAAADVQRVRPEKVRFVKERFETSMPVEGDVSLGELICGAWELFSMGFDAAVEDSKHLELIASNLVLKSSEAIEFRSRMKIAGN